jgi:uncharacterized protein YggT (Ycf19 family)
VNDVKYNILSSIKLFADDTALIKEIDNPVNDFRELNNNLERVDFSPSIITTCIMFVKSFQV